MTPAEKANAQIVQTLSRFVVPAATGQYRMVAVIALPYEPEDNSIIFAMSDGDGLSDQAVLRDALGHLSRRLPEAAEPKLVAAPDFRE